MIRRRSGLIVVISTVLAGLTPATGGPLPFPPRGLVYVANGFPVQITVGVSHDGGANFTNIQIDPRSGQNISCGPRCILAVSTHGSVASITAFGGKTYMLVFSATQQRYELRLP